MHLSQLIENASASVTNIDIVLQKAKMALMMDVDFTEEQKHKLMALLEPTEKAIATALSNFVVDVEK